MAPDATRTGDDVTDAISRGAAERAIPSPMLLVQVDASNHLKLLPNRRGASTSPNEDIAFS
ncbi:hypothetical protein [Arthrobacter sp. MDT3-44]